MQYELPAPIDFSQIFRSLSHIESHRSRMVPDKNDHEPTIEELEYADSEKRLQTIVDAVKKVLSNGQIAVIVMVPHIVHWVCEQTQQTLGKSANDVNSIAKALEPKLGGPNSELVAEHVIRASTRAQLGIQNRNSIELRASSAKQYKADLDCYFEDPDLHAIIALLTPLKDFQKTMGYEEAQLSSIRYHIGILNFPQEAIQPNASLTSHSNDPNHISSLTLSRQLSPAYREHCSHWPASDTRSSSEDSVDGGLDRSEQVVPVYTGSNIQPIQNRHHNNFAKSHAQGSSINSPRHTTFGQDHFMHGSSIGQDHAGLSRSVPGRSMHFNNIYPATQSPYQQEPLSADDARHQDLQNHSMHDFIPTMLSRELEYFYAMLPNSNIGAYSHHELELARSQSIGDQEQQAHDPDDLDPHQIMRLNQQRSLSPVLPRRPRDLAEVQAEIERARLLASSIVTSHQGNGPSNKKHGDIRCLECGTDTSPEWRKGPNGPKTLCNRCGLRFAKKLKMQK